MNIQSFILSEVSGQNQAKYVFLHDGPRLPPLSRLLHTCNRFLQKVTVAVCGVAVAVVVAVVVGGVVVVVVVVVGGGGGFGLAVGCLTCWLLKPPNIQEEQTGTCFEKSIEPESMAHAL
jgi:hypothetical protein